MKLISTFYCNLKYLHASFGQSSPTFLLAQAESLDQTPLFTGKLTHNFLFWFAEKFFVDVRRSCFRADVCADCRLPPLDKAKHVSMVSHCLVAQERVQLLYFSGSLYRFLNYSTRETRN